MSSRLGLSALVVLLMTFPVSVNAQPGNYAAPPPAPASTVAQEAPRQLNLALGLGLGHHWQDSEQGGNEMSLMGRIRVSNAIFLGAEIANIEFDDGTNSGRLGGDLGIYLRQGLLAKTYLTIGGGWLDADDDRGAASYAELGLGIDVPIGRRLSLLGEARLSGRGLTDDDQENAFAARWRGMLLVRF